MSHTIRNERTRNYLDHLAKERKTRKMVREQKADSLFFDEDIIDDMSINY